MKLTNRLGLPEAFVRAVERDPYNNYGTLSVTTLIRPPQMVWLEKAHWNDIEEDVSDRVWTIFGQANHTALERTSQKGDINEERFYMDIDGVRVSGQLDRLSAIGVLVDWKFTSVWAVADCLKNGMKKDWEQQLNMLAALVRENRKKRMELPEPKALRIIAVCRDWRQFEAERGGYPNKVEVLKAPMWPHDEAMAFIKKRVRLHTMETPVLCTDEDRWAKSEQWAVMGKSKALRLLNSEDEAKKWAASEGINNPKIERRPAKYTRCERFCSVAPFCPQWEAINGKA